MYFYYGIFQMHTKEVGRLVYNDTPYEPLTHFSNLWTALSHFLLPPDYFEAYLQNPVTSSINISAL